MDEHHQANTGEFETVFCSFCIKKIVLLQSVACTEEKHALVELEPTPPPERQGKKGASNIRSGHRGCLIAFWELKSTAGEGKFWFESCLAGIANKYQCPLTKE